MQAEGFGCTALVCLYCGAQAELDLAAADRYCDCRSAAHGEHNAKAAQRPAPAFAASAA
jgi:hypothetical protein